jgi:hypothetical protein
MAEPMKALNADEFDRMWRVVDQSLSAHAILRDRYRRCERSLTLLIVGLSIVATAFAFFTGNVTIAIWQWRLSLATGIGILTAAIFFLALAQLVLNWQRLAWAHEDAGRRLGDLKAKLRSAKVAGVASLSDTEALDLRALYDQTMADVVEIPENKFLPLKAKHHRKVAVSRLIDKHPGAPLPYLRLVAMVRGLREHPEPDKANQEPDEPAEVPPK